MEHKDRKFRALRIWLLVTVALLMLQSLSWIVLGSFDPFGVWDRLMYEAIFDGKSNEAVERFRKLVIGPLGASVAAYWIVVFSIVWFVFPRREPWGWWAVTGSLATWFVTDCIASLVHGALFNVWLVNIPCLLIVGIPLALLYPHVCGERGKMVDDRGAINDQQKTN